MKEEFKTVIAYVVGMICVAVGFGVAVAGDEAEYETGVVRTKKDSALYISPRNDTLVGRKIQFSGEPKYKEAYDIINFGDTVKFYNPKHDINITATQSFFDVKINGKDLADAKRDFDKIKQLQQIQREVRQK